MGRFWTVATQLEVPEVNGCRLAREQSGTALPAKSSRAYAYDRLQSDY